MRAFTAATADGFLDRTERGIVEAVTARILPTDGSPGAREAGVADYIQGLLSAFPAADANFDRQRGAADLTEIGAAHGTSEAAADIDLDGQVTSADAALATTSLFAGRPIFAGGPFSGRTPYADAATGTASDRFPPNRFLDFLALPRVKRLAWTVRLLGAAAVPEVADNPLATSLSDVDMRRKYRDGLAQIDDLAVDKFGQPFVALSPPQQDEVLVALQAVNRPFFDLLAEHTIEGLLCAPEYGGNCDMIGWRLVGFDGDSQPLGYTIYDETLGAYRERPEKPNSTLNPEEDCSGLSEEMSTFLRFVLVTVSGGEEFPEPFCFGLDT